MATIKVIATIETEFESDTDPADTTTLEEMRADLHNTDGALLDLLENEGFSVVKVEIKVTDV